MYNISSGSFYHIIYSRFFSAQSERAPIPENSDNAPSDEEYSYDYDEDWQDGNYDGEREGDEESRATFIPQFTTEAQEFKVSAQYTVRLPCRVDRLGKIFQTKA